MNPDKATELAERLLEYPEPEWNDLIKKWCGHDAELEKEVRRLSDHNRNARDFIEELQNRIYSLTKSSLDEGGALPKQIAGYKVIRRLGSGGSATVFEIEMKGGKKAALKVLRGALADSYSRRRFKSEQQILSALNHPNIAKMIAGGITESGEQYVIMEYVDGISIDTWCNSKKLDINSRLRLFQTVCRAVHYAHQNLVVHRDIKPEHVLVTNNGEIKLIDFGIAKLLEPSHSNAASMQTHTGMRVMTPEYASPEQVRGEIVSTSSDIYSLGVLLYLLLTGQNPYRFKTTSMLEVERVVCEQEPVKPSAISQENSGAENPGFSVVPPNRLQKILSGDLDRIILKAMRKEPAQRYASPLSLADDLENYLRGEPVIARAPTIRYRARKFVTRHKWAVAAAALAFLSLTGGLIGTLWQKQQAQLHAEHAEIQAQRAEQVAAFLTELFEGSDPNKANDGTMTAREMLDQGFEKVQTELADQPAVQAQMLGIIGKVYQNLGMYNQSLPALEMAVQGFRDIGESSAQYVSALLQLGNLQYRMGHLNEAEATTREALKLNTSFYGPDHAEVASVLNTLAIIHEGKGELEEAIHIMRRVIEIRKEQPEPGSNLAANLNNLATLLHRTGELEEADELFSEALAEVKSVWGEHHPYMAFTLNGYAGVLQQRGFYDRAEADLRRALEIGNSFFPETHPFIAVVLHNLGKLFEETGKYDKAADYYDSGLERRRSSLPPDHPDIASSLEGLAGVLIETRRPDEAEPLLRNALEIMQYAFDPDDWRIAKAEAHLGRSLLLQKRFAEAETVLTKSYATLKNSRGDEDVHTRRALEDLVSLQNAIGVD